MEFSCHARNVRSGTLMLNAILTLGLFYVSRSSYVGLGSLVWELVFTRFGCNSHAQVMLGYVCRFGMQFSRLRYVSLGAPVSRPGYVRVCLLIWDAIVTSTLCEVGNARFTLRLC